MKQRVIVDVNILSPFLEKIGTSDIHYALGDAVDVWEDRSFLPEKDRDQKPILIAMSNLINVLSPQKAWHLIEVKVQRMSPGDFLVITTIHEDQFNRRLNYAIGVECDGIINFKKSKTNEAYKSTVARDFEKYIDHRLSSLRLIAKEDNNLDGLFSGRSDGKGFKGLFSTFLFTKQ